MRKETARPASLLAAVLLLLAALTGCASKGARVMTYGRSAVTDRMYHYWMSSYKGVFSQTYADYADNDSFWEKELSNGQTVVAYLNGLVRDNVMRTMVCAELYDKAGGRLSDGALQEIDGLLDKLESTYADGSRNAFNALLAEYGINRDILREIYVMEEKVSALQDMLFASGGTLSLTDEDREAYCRKNYVHAYLIMINDAFRYEKNEDGSFVRDETTGDLKTRALTPEEAEVEANRISVIKAALSGGADFKTVMNLYSEAAEYYGGADPYPEGYFLTGGMDFITGVVTAAFDAEVGQWRVVSSDRGTFFVYRDEMPAGAWKNAVNADFFPSYDDTVRTAKFVDYLAPELGKVQTDENALAAWSLKDVSPNYRY